MPRGKGTILAIRLALHGCTNRPFYHMVVMHSHKGRNSKYIEQIGSYDPMPNDHNEKLVAINFDRFNYWFTRPNVVLSQPVEKLMGLAGYFPLHPMTYINAKRIRKEAEKLKQNAESMDTESMAAVAGS